MGKNQHVTPHPKGGWQVKGAGNNPMVGMTVSVAVAVEESQK